MNNTGYIYSARAAHYSCRSWYGHLTFTVPVLCRHLNLDSNPNFTRKVRKTPLAKLDVLMSFV